LTYVTFNGDPPKITVESDVNPNPLIDTCVPPDGDPELGEMPLTMRAMGLFGVVDLEGDVGASFPHPAHTTRTNRTLAVSVEAERRLAMSAPSGLKGSYRGSVKRPQKLALE